MRQIMLMLVLCLSHPLVASALEPVDVVPEQPAHHDLWRISSQSQEPGLGMRGSPDTNGRFAVLVGSRRIHRNPERQGGLAEVAATDQQASSEIWGTVIGGVVGAGLGVLAGMSYVILDADNPKNKDLAIGGTIGGLVGAGLGVLVGRWLDPGKRTGLEPIAPR